MKILKIKMNKKNSDFFSWLLFDSAEIILLKSFHEFLILQEPEVVLCVQSGKYKTAV